MKRLDIQIIDYISGEMGDLDRISFEQLMESDPSIKAQVEEMQTTQSTLGSWNDELINVPHFELPLLEDTQKETKIVQMRTISPWIKYAASAAAVVGLLWISGLQMNTSDNAMTLSFGTPSLPTDNMDERIDLAVSKALEKYSANQSAQLAQFSNQLGSEIGAIKTSVNAVSTNWKNEKSAVQVMMDNLSTQQFAKLETIINQYQLNQGAKLDASFADLMEYIDDKRLDDLNQIQGAFTEIVAAIDEQQERTDEIFQGLVQPVATNY